MSFNILTIINSPNSSRILQGLSTSATRLDCSFKHELYPQKTFSIADIADADCVLVVSDSPISLDRFDGKKIIHLNTLDAVHRAFKFVKSAQEGFGELYSIPLVTESIEIAQTTEEPKKKRKLFFRK